MACICGHEAGSPVTQRIHERNCIVASVTTAPVKRVAKKATEGIKKTIRGKKAK